MLLFFDYIKMELLFKLNIKLHFGITFKRKLGIHTKLKTCFKILRTQ